MKVRFLGYKQENGRSSPAKLTPGKVYEVASQNSAYFLLFDDTEEWNFYTIWDFVPASHSTKYKTKKRKK